MRHTDIEGCFNQRFLLTQNTRMVGGASEPLYVPGSEKKEALLYYRDDHSASALHEAAHWCIAGQRRRGLVDFGYRYQPPPRSGEAQQAFFDLEVRAQSLEYLFAQAAAVDFYPSADNLEADLQPFETQLESVIPIMRAWVDSSPDPRARQLIEALRLTRECLDTVTRPKPSPKTGFGEIRKDAFGSR